MPQVSYRDVELGFVINGAGLKQTAFGSPRSDSDMNYLIPLTNKGVVELQEDAKEQRDCTDEFVIGKRVDSRFSRKTLEFLARTKPLAIFSAYGLGASAVSGAQANEVQTITIDATGGTFTVSLDFEGVVFTSEAIAWDASAAVITATINRMFEAAYGKNAVNITLLSLVYTVNFQNGLARANLPLLTTNAANLTGGAGTATVGADTNGNQYKNAITLATGYQLPYWGAIEGFFNSSIKPKRLYDFVVTSLGIQGAAGGDVTVSIGTNGNGQTPRLVSFSFPACDDIFGWRFADVRVKIGSTYYSLDLRAFNFQYSTGSEIDDDAFTAASIDIQRAERASQRLMPTLALDILGEDGDSLYESARTRTQTDVQLLIGYPGDRIEINLPNAELTLDTPALAFDGAKRRSVIKLIAEGRKLGSTLPLNINAYFNQSTTLLATS